MTQLLLEKALLEKFSHLLKENRISLGIQLRLTILKVSKQETETNSYPVQGFWEQSGLEKGLQ